MIQLLLNFAYILSLNAHGPLGDWRRYGIPQCLVNPMIIIIVVTVVILSACRCSRPGFTGILLFTQFSLPNVGLWKQNMTTMLYHLSLLLKGARSQRFCCLPAKTITYHFWLLLELKFRSKTSIILCKKSNPWYILGTITLKIDAEFFQISIHVIRNNREL